jgi:ADP-heptose:LPS heptosyltransferase
LKSIFVGSIKDNISEHDNRLINGREHIINYIGKNSLVQTIFVIQNAFIIISNDTGLAHIGAISNIPVVVVSNGNHYGRFTEYPKELGVKVLYAYPPQLINSKLSFSKLVQKYQYRSDLDINTIGVEMVYPLIDSLLK